MAAPPTINPINIKGFSVEAITAKYAPLVFSILYYVGIVVFIVSLIVFAWLVRENSSWTYFQIALLYFSIAVGLAISWYYHFEFFYIMLVAFLLIIFSVGQSI